MDKDNIIIEGNRESGIFATIKSRLSKLSFRTGVIVLLSCIPFYILSFAQFALPLSIGVKSGLWVVFFGLAKTFQYGGLTILGAKGLSRLREWWRSRKREMEEKPN